MAPVVAHGALLRLPHVGALTLHGCGAHLLQEQAGTLHAMGMLDYSALKGRILVTTAALVAAGSSLCYRCAALLRNPASPFAWRSPLTPPAAWRAATAWGRPWGHHSAVWHSAQHSRQSCSLLGRQVCTTAGLLRLSGQHEPVGELEG